MHLFTALQTVAPQTKARVSNRPASTRDAPRHKRPAVLVVLITVAVVLAGFLSWFILFSPVTVSIAPVEMNVREQVYGLGVVGARVQSNVGFKVAGVLAALMVDQGDRVHAGQVLAKLDARDIEAQVDVMKAGVSQARANIDKAKSDVVSAEATLSNAKAISARRDILVEKRFASIEEAQINQTTMRVAEASLASARSAVEVAEAAFQSAEAQVIFQQATLAYYTLYAPYDGWVISRNLELGSMPNLGQSVFTLVAADTVWAVGYVDERLAGRLSIGQPAEIVLRSDQDTRIPGHVARIEIQSDPVNEERLVDVAFDQMPQNIHLAEQAYVYITTGTLPRAVLVSPAGISDLHDGYGTVWTVEDGRLARRQVTLGPQLLDGRLPIRDGLQANAAVVAAPVSGLRVGRAARIVEAPHR